MVFTYTNNGRVVLIASVGNFARGSQFDNVYAEHGCIDFYTAGTLELRYWPSSGIYLQYKKFD
jgi:hypothetical protein